MAAVCEVKAEFLVKKNNAPAGETKENGIEISENSVGEESPEGPSDAKKIKIEFKEQELAKVKNRARGQNKSRPRTFQEKRENVACPTIVNVKVSEAPKICTYKNCFHIHNPEEYLKIKPKDIAPDCHLFIKRGWCPRGLTCRFGANHLTTDGFNIVDEEKFKLWKDDVHNSNTRNIQVTLERRKYDLAKSEKVKNYVESLMDEKKKDGNNPPGNGCGQPEQISNISVNNSGAVTDEDIIKLLAREKKSVDWCNKLYLSPLTTVGNLPFRRICKTLGADITCGEMALCESLLKGSKQEWALLKRHESEDIFGVQICGTSPNLISKVAQVIEENITVDFVDLNLGCPIDLVYKKGGGCGMMLRHRALESSIRCASQLVSVPFTVKMRTGVYQDKKIAHNLVPKFADWGAALVTLHGRSREARYSWLADWEYIEQCAKAAAPCPVIGNGDILSYEDYLQRREMAPSVQGVMIGRGALIKPWIFTEIKEQRLWDISSSERYDILKTYTNNGLEHWGSDTMGVENTRRFLLEWLSFLYRYVPVGLLERPPQKINERPPTFFGRDDLETLMASGNCSDWIKISEMLLGPVPDGFNFLPKHKASSYK